MTAAPTGETPVGGRGYYLYSQTVPVAFSSNGILINGHPVGRILRPTNEVLGTLYDGAMLVGEIATVALVVAQLLKATK